MQSIVDKFFYNLIRLAIYIIFELNDSSRDKYLNKIYVRNLMIN